MMNTPKSGCDCDQVLESAPKQDSGRGRRKPYLFMRFFILFLILLFISFIPILPVQADVENVFTVITAGDPKQLPDAAFNPNTNSTLVVWTERWGSTLYDTDTVGRIIYSDGTMSGDFLIESSSDTSHQPAVAAAASGNYWIVVYYGYNTGLEFIRSCRVNSDGTVPSCWNVNTPGICDVGQPDIGVDTATGNFLVVWADENDFSFNYEIRGRLLSGVSGPTGSELTILDTPILGHNKFNPAVNQRGSGFFVTAEKILSSTEKVIEGRYVAGDGSMPSASFVVSPATGVNLFPDVAWRESSTAKYFVTWHRQRDENNYDIHFAFCDPIARTCPTTDFASYTSAIEYKPSAMYSGIPGKYVIAYEKAPNGSWGGDWDIYVIGVTSGGVLDSQEEFVYDSDTNDGTPAGTTISSTAGKTMFVWDTNDGLGSTIYGANYIAKPKVFFSSSSYSISESGGSATITVKLSRTSTSSVSVYYSTSNGTATAGSDYSARSGTLTIPAGQISATFSVPILSDSIDEPNETVNLTLSSPNGAILGSPSSAVLTITDDDPTPSISFSNSIYSANENGGSASISVMLSNASSQTVSVYFSTSNGTATAGSDYTATSGTLTFSPGQTITNLSVPILNDSLDEPNETVNMSLSSPSGATLGSPSTAVLTIVDEDPTPSVNFSSSSYSVNENGGSISITVLLSNPSSQTVTVGYYTEDRFATAGSDYVATSGTLTFTPGQTSRSFSVSILNDTVYETDEDLYLILTSPSGAVLGSTSSALLTIINDDPEPAITFSSTNYNVNENAGTVQITVQLSNPSIVDVYVQYSTSNGTATAPVDYTSSSGYLTIPDPQTSITFNVPIVNDSEDEPNETINLSLSAPINGHLGTPSTATITIVDDDLPPVPQVRFSSSSYSVNENGGAASITVQLSSASSSSVSVYYSTSNGTASAGSDYTATSGWLTFSAGQTSLNFNVPILNDSLVEGSETVNLALSSPSGANLGSPSTAVLTIVDDDSPPVPQVRFSSSSYSVNENGGTASITVQLSSAAASTVTVNYSTANGTATAGSDYTATSGTLTFSAGQTSLNFNVPILNDSIDESNETVNLSLSGPSGATLGTPSTAVLTILDEDPTPSVYFSSSSYSLSESGGSASIQVRLSNPSSSSVSVNYSTSNGTASAGSDYTATSGTLTFSAGQTSASFSVPILNDSLVEGNETVNLALSSPSGASLGAPSTAVLTILDDDSAVVPQVHFSSTSYSVNEGGGTASITVQLTSASSSSVSVYYSTSNGTASAGSDYNAASGWLTFSAGQTSLNFNVPILNDSLAESNETVNLSLSSPSGASLGSPSSAVLTILDDDGVALPQVYFSSSSYEVNEDDGVVQIPVLLSYSSSTEITVYFTTSDGTAQAGSDYLGRTFSLLIPAGISSSYVNLTIYDDLFYEDYETINLTLSSPSGATLGSPNTAVVTILDNDGAATPTVSLESSGYYTNENCGLAQFTAQLSNPAATNVTVSYSTSGGTASAGSDYGATSGTLTFPPGQTSASFSVTLLDDLLEESEDEYFWITLSSPNGATLGTPSQAWVYILDNEFGKVEPYDWAIFQPTTLTLDWENSSWMNTTYEYCLDLVNDDACENWISTGSVSQVTVSGLKRGGIYFWQVRATNDSGTTEADNGVWWRFYVTPDSLDPPSGMNKIYLPLVIH